MNSTYLPSQARPFHLQSKHRCRGSAVTQTLLIVVILLAGFAAGVFIWRSGGKVAVGETQEQKAGVESKEKEKDRHEEKGGHAVKGRVEMTPEKLKNARLTIEPAQPATIRLGLRVFGKVMPDEERLAHVSPRFAGIARKVNKRLGESVAAGETLATVESNESLQTYDIKAPLGGTIIEREVTVGEFVGTDKSLFTVADLTTVWVDFQIYQQDFARLRVGQPVRISTQTRVTSAVPAETPSPLKERGSTTLTGTAADGHTPVQSEAESGGVRSTVAYLSPFGAQTTQTMLARAYVSNQAGTLRPGLFVTGEIAVDEVQAPVTVREDAVQRLDGKEVVFVQEGDSFEARVVQIGQRDGDRAEVLSGLQPAERYVAVNSSLLKAEIGKEGAAED